MDSIIPNYYDNYHGHTIPHLTHVYSALRGLTLESPRLVFLLGDSSLDNKYWVNKEKVTPVPRYRAVLKQSVPDVCYWMNHFLAQNDKTLNKNRVVALNCAVEASSLGERNLNLLPQDVFVKDRLQSKDILVVSVGGNDIALKPSAATCIHMGSLILLPLNMIKWNPSYNYFLNLFREGTQQYLENVCSKAIPYKIVVSGIYFPCIHGSGWADGVLALLGYNSNPTKLQAIIRMIFKDSLEGLTVRGRPVLYVPLHDVLDPTDAGDYVSRVEPSSAGGKKIALAYLTAFSKKS